MLQKKSERGSNAVLTALTDTLMMLFTTANKVTNVITHVYNASQMISFHTVAALFELVVRSHQRFLMSYGGTRL